MNNINRVNKFFSEDDFDFNIKIGQEYMMNDLQTTLYLYKIDYDKIEDDDIYAEVGKGDIVVKNKYEINCVLKIDESKNSAYKNGLIRYNEPGNLTFHVYISHLQKIGVDINYGDYIGYPENENKMRYYSVTNDGNIVDSKHSMFGYKQFYKTIICTPIQENEFNGF